MFEPDVVTHLRIALLILFDPSAVLVVAEKTGSFLSMWIIDVLLGIIAKPTLIRKTLIPPGTRTCEHVYGF
jgi:hypothetical protein